MSGPKAREWDGRSYDRMATPMTERGLDLVAELELEGDEAVMDAGCGTGRVTEAVLRKLPRGRVIALDGSRSMLEQASERIGDDPRVELVCADLTEPLPDTVPPAGIDAIVSTSTFHWIADHDALFANLRSALRPGGRLAVDCGGSGNAETIVGILADLGHPDHPWTFESVEATRKRLHRAGFEDVHARLVPKPAVLERDRLEEYLATVVLGTHLRRMDRERGEKLVRDVAERMPEPVIDYVRLQFTARAA